MPAFKHRVIMIDMARMVQRWAHYEWLMPWLKNWGYNTIQLRISDDHGCRLRFPSRPELASRESFDVEQMGALVQSANRNGLEVIPEIECFGHAGYIVNNPGHSGLGFDGEEDFNALDPECPGTLELLGDLIRDLADVFKHPIIHVGMDEVNLRALRRFRNADESTLEDVFAGHMARVHGLVRKAGRRPAMWGDHLLKSSRLLKRLRKDVLVFDWHYGGDFDPASLDFFCSKGLEVWGAASTMAWGSRVVTHRSSIQNIRQFSAAAMSRRRKGVKGMINTVWCPWRYLSGAMDYPMALGGHLFCEKEESGDFSSSFSGKLYGLSGRNARECGLAIERLHRIAPWRTLFDTIVFGKDAQSNMSFTREQKRASAELAQECGEVGKILYGILPRAKRNAERLRDVYLSARILERVGKFGKAGRRKSSMPSGQGLLRQCVLSWKRSRDWKWGEAIQKFERGEDIPCVLSRLV